MTAGNISAFGTSGITVNTSGILDLNGYNVANVITLNGGTLLGAQNRTATLAATAGNTVVSSNVGGAVTIASGASVKLDAGVAVAGGVTVNSGGRINGTGNAGNLALNTGGTIAPGNSPGILHASNVTWSGGATYEWEINNTIGAAGTAFDQVAATGILDVQAGAANKFIIKVLGLDGANAHGAVQNWNGATDYSWIIAAAQGGVQNFDAGAFSIDTSGFTDNNAVNGNGFSLEKSADGTAIILRYDVAAVPEPSTYGLLGAGTLATAAFVRRRRKVA